MGRKPASSVRCLYCGDRIHQDKHGRLRDRSGRLTCVFPPHPYHAQQLELDPFRLLAEVVELPLPANYGAEPGQPALEVE